jgi:hypothetical protein
MRDRFKIWLIKIYVGIRNSLCALPQAIFWKIAGDADRFSTLKVSRATHLPDMPGAAGLLYPAP